MSCYEWERGTIVLPSSDFPKVHAACVTAMGKHADELYELTQEFWKWLPAKAKRNVTLYQEYLNAWLNGNGQHHDGWGYKEHLPTVKARITGDGDIYWELQSLLSHSAVTETIKVTKDLPNGRSFETSEQRQRANAPIRITKAIVTARFPATNRTLSFPLGESHLSFDRKTRTVTWSVGENNHARDRGREHPVARAFFRALGQVKWTRGSGGVIVGNDEYNRDSDYPGGGGNYIIDQFGPLGDRNVVHMASF